MDSMDIISSAENISNALDSVGAIQIPTPEGPIIADGVEGAILTVAVAGAIAYGTYKYFEKENN